jgi:hypothetical protein
MLMGMLSLGLLALAVAAAASSAAPPAGGQPPQGQSGPAAEALKPERQVTEAEPPAPGAAAQTWQEAERLYQAGQWQEAIAKYQALPPDWAGRDRALFHTACAYARLGNKAQAAAHLKQAVDGGFVFFSSIERDPALDPIRGEDAYKAVVARKEDCLKANAARRVGIYRTQLGASFNVETDDAYRLIVCTDLPAEARGRVLQMLHAIADALGRDLFTQKPEVYIGLLVPANAADFARKIGRPGVAGTYNPQNRTLIVNLATGPGTMAHEYAHALHFADMERRGQQHPMWIVEGLGALCEQSGLKEGHLVGVVNWRLPILKQAIGRQEAIPLADLLAKSDSYFADQRRLSVAYAQARYVMLFLQEKGLLAKWYDRYCREWSADPTGVKALEAVYGKPLKDFEADWLSFVAGLAFQMPSPPKAPPPAGPN